MQNSTEILSRALQECENEPIRIPGSIQPHGILIVLRSSDLTILQISESVFDLAGVHHSELLHQPLSRLMSIEPVEKATKRLGDRTPRLLNPIPLHLTAHGKSTAFDGILHRSGRVLILELERHVAEEKGYGGFGGFYEAIREVTSKMMVTENLCDVLQLACDELRKLTGFSRVLTYKFDPDWNGEVISESRQDDIEPLLHHNFPASDIPRQARELYTTNWLRLIPDADYQPSKVVPPINPLTDMPLDLSNSVLRSVSPVHVEYMRNMGQRASMSVSLLKGKQLWGLISCHHPTAHYLKYDVRVAAEFIGQMVSAQIIAREDSAELDGKLQLKKLYDDLLRHGGGYTSIPSSFSLNTTSLLGLIDAEGAALIFSGVITCVGTTPVTSEIEEVRDFLILKNEILFSTQSIHSAIGRKIPFSASAAGVLAISIRENSHDYIIWFRPEHRNQVKWAGNPTSGKFVAADGKIHPRKSFETWYENIKGKARPWSQREIELADELRRSLSAMSVAIEPKEIKQDAQDNLSFRQSLTSAIATKNSLRDVSASIPFSADNPSAHSAFDSSLLLEGFSEFAVLFLDRAGAIQNWSVGAKRILGYESSDILGKNLNVFLGSGDALIGKDAYLIDSARSHTRCVEELWLYRRDQTSFWGKILVSQVRDRQATLIGYSVVIQDITQEKSSEEELKAMKVAAEAANKSKTAFLANISHEIRTPLGAVLGFAELMSSQELSFEDRLDLFSKVRRNGEQLTILINDLLDISKVESGKIETEQLDVDLETLLFDCNHLFTTKAVEKGIELKFEIKGSVPKTVSTDPTRLRQILINMLSNAIKFTPRHGKVTLTCSQDQALDHKQIVFRVTDTGRGMSEKEMDRLFQPFSQADASMTRQYGGTGLGLFLSQRLARALGGDISIEWSNVGEGSCFIASIDPGAKVDTSVTFSKIHPPERRPINDSYAEQTLRGLKILIVDDSADNRELITTYLKKAGAEIRTAENGKTGVAKAASENFDIVLMDIQMPVIDGNQAMMMLKNKGYSRPVVALTAHAMKEERDVSLRSGFIDYLTKPINRKLLIETIRRIAHPAK